MSDIKWIKLTTDIFDDEKIRLIEAMPDADTLLIIWIKLLCLAGKVNANGYLFLSRDMSQTVTFSVENLATLFNRPINTTRLALATFQRFGMVTIEENGTIFLPNWSKHQNVVGLDSIREHARLRQQKYRQQLALRDGNVTSQTVTSLKRHQNKKENKKENKNTPITPLPEWLEKDVWDAFMEMRINQRAKPTGRAITLLLSELSKLRDSGNDPSEVLKQSIMNNWKGLFALKGTDARTQGTQSQNTVYRGNPSQRPAGAFDGLS